MDFMTLLFLCLVSVFIGIVLTLVVQYYVLVRYFNKGPMVETPKKINNQAYSLPEALKKKLDEGDATADNVNSSLPVSLMLQFLFHELRHSDAIKRWLFKKLTLEFDELLTKTTIGKFFEAVTIRDMNLGTQFPDIKDISLDNIKLDKGEGHIDTLNLSIKLDYTGNFLLSVDAKMKFGKTAYLSIKVKRISGIARLQFTRIPYTHWSFSFYNDPLIELAVESHFQGRQLQSNITNLIVNQIKKAIKRKHTLPNYKIRYKPFFVKTDPGQLDADESEILPQGQLEVSCSEVSRLDVPSDVSNVYCTFTLDTIPFICVYQTTTQKDTTMCLMLDLTIIRIRQQQLGVIFKQEQHVVIVDTITPSTPAAAAGLKPGDVVLAIENRNVTNVSQISKIMKSVSSVNISIKVERYTNCYAIRNKSLEKTESEKTPTISLNDEEGALEPDSFVVIEKPEEPIERKCRRSDRVPKIISTSNENMSKFAQTIGNFTLRKRKASVERASTDSSNKSTPTPSCPGTPQHNVFKAHAMNLPTNFILQKKNSISEVPEIIQTDPENQETELLNFTDVHRGKDVGLDSVMFFNDDYVFSLKESVRYLNVNVWGVTGGRDVLLGYANIPVAEILNACVNSMLGHYIRSFSLLPPNSTPPTSQSHPLMTHSGFEHVFCYGDILLSFVWNHEDSVEMQKNKCPVLISEEVDLKPIEKQITNQHDFIRTQFHRTIHCDFCSKKIWLKDAVQCRGCSLCCHKKCISKCQLSTDCIPIDKTSLKNDLSDNMVESMEDNSQDDDLISDNKNMKRVNSANNLSLPGAHLQSSQSRSLPPSPNRTPSRKQSLVVTNPFSLGPAVLEEIQNNPLSSAESVSKLLEQVMMCAGDDSLMETARETGRQLYSEMGADDKAEKINAMMSELKKMFDTVTNEHADLCKQMNHEEAEVEKARLAFLLGQADAKIHSLSVLMLHYCSGLQQT